MADLASAIVDTQAGVELRFRVTDNGSATPVPVTYTGIVPDLFRPGQGVIAIGALDDSIRSSARYEARRQPHQRRQMSNAIDRMRTAKIIRGALAQRLDRVMAEMLVEPRPPGRA